MGDTHEKTDKEYSPHMDAKGRGSKTVFWIGLFKLIKGLLLIAVGVGAVKLMHRDVESTVVRWVEAIRVDPDNRFIHGLLSRVSSATPEQLKAAGVGTFIYAGLLLIEGVGLELQKRWAEIFTIVTTGGLIPLELYELSRHVTPVKIMVLLVNAAIVVYLVMRVRRS